MISSSGHESIDGDFSITDLTIGGDAFYKSSSSSFRHGDRETEFPSSAGRMRRGRRTSTLAYEEERDKARKKLRRWKLVIVVMAILLTVIVSVMVFFGMTQANQDNFQMAYLYGAERIVLTMENNLLDELRSIESLAEHISSYASGKEVEWPFLEPIPDFAAHATRARWPSTGGTPSSLSLISYVTDSNREQYEEFITRQTYLGNNNTLLDDPNIIGDVFPEIFELAEEPASDGVRKKVPSPLDSGPFFPVWLSDPNNLDAVNFNLASTSSEWSIQLNYVMESFEALITNSVDVESSNRKAESGSLQRTPMDEPQSRILFPLIDGSGTAVGVLTSTFSWTSVLSNSLVGEDEAYIVEIDSACTQAFSFRVVGPEVEFLGPGLLHATRYNNLKYTYNPSNSLHGRAKGSMLIGLFESKCPYQVHVYPTESLEDAITSNDAIYYTLGVTLIFLLVTAIFCLFAVVMERRQKRIIRSADEASAIVSSLFPSRVRGRLLAHQRDMRGTMKKLFKLGKQPRKTSKKNMHEEQLTANSEDGLNEGEQGSSNEFQLGGTQVPRRRSRLKTYLDESSTFVRLNDTNSRPIADSFPSATILFADLVGFTSWCSLREPEKVFVLLEGIFSAFDIIAKQRKVFKVET
jgi:hypothetical protein